MANYQFTQSAAEIQALLNKVQNEMGNLSNLETTDKSTLVNAINEAATTGSGGGEDSRIVNIEENVFAFVDESLNIGAYLDGNGFHAPNILDYEIVTL